MTYPQGGYQPRGAISPPRGAGGVQDPVSFREREQGPKLSPAEYVQLDLFELLTGYTVNAVRMKIKEGVWLEGHEYVRAPDGRVLVSMKGYERWVEGKRAPV